MTRIRSFSDGEGHRPWHTSVLHSKLLGKENSNDDLRLLYLQMADALSYHIDTLRKLDLFEIDQLNPPLSKKKLDRRVRDASHLVVLIQRPPNTSVF